MSDTFADASKLSWVTNNGLQPSNEQLMLGCLQRIATATEIMSHDYRKLIVERENYKRWYEQEKLISQRMARSINSLRGHITRLKKKTK